MIAKYSKRSLWIGLPGVLLQAACLFLPGILASPGKDSTLIWASLGWIVGSTLGSILFMVGLGYYAKAKGYNAALGLLGLLTCVGLLILAVLPDRTKGQGGEMK
ncbi:MAG TPA: hypothetical protein VFV23_13215 [Verrucomicrobiae bacterium]|nr:hypothetical protein [Verrucomicrobiae bacterium]